MAETIFKFQETEDVNESTDIKLCANRWALYNALSEVNSLIRKLYNGKTYHEKCMYKIGERKLDWGELVADYSTIKPDEVDNEESIEFIDVDYIVRELSDAIEDVRFILDE